MNTDNSYVPKLWAERLRELFENSITNVEFHMFLVDCYHIIDQEILSMKLQACIDRYPEQYKKFLLIRKLRLI